jgi:uncharacterized membrane protein YccC
MKPYSRKRLVKLLFGLRHEHFVNALRITLTVIIPVIICYRMDRNSAGIDIGLGTLLVGLSDVPGNPPAKAGSLAAGSLTLCLVSLSIQLVLSSPLYLGIDLVVFCFGFSMLALYGGSSGAIGSLSLIMMVFTMGLRPVNDVFFSLFILAGGLWYTFSSVLYGCLFPYRAIRFSLGECIMEVANFLDAKACFYQMDTPLADCYKQVIARHLRVTEKQEAVRSLLLNERLLVYQDDAQSRQLLWLATEVIDLYEQVLAAHYDYIYIRQTLDEAEVLKPVNRLIKIMAAELHQSGLNISAGLVGQQLAPGRMALLTKQLQNAASKAPAQQAGLIGRIIANLEVIRAKTEGISILHRDRASKHQSMPGHDAIRFASDQSFDLRLLLRHLTFQSPIFRFALRITFTCLIAYLAIVNLLPGKYNYWLLLTIVIVGRPGFSTTRKRNFQRITGTLIGILAAFVISNCPFSNGTQLILVCFFLLGYLGFLYIDYLVSVIFITLVVIMGLHLAGANNNELMLQRGYETLLGGGAALTATFLFPFWEHSRLKELVSQALRANIDYLGFLREMLHLRPVDLIDYKLARKRVFVSSANLSRAYQHMLREPVTDSAAIDRLYQLQVFNHELYTCVASLFLDRLSGNAAIEDADHSQHIDHAIAYLNDSLKAINSVASFSVSPSQHDDEIKPIEGSLHKALLKQQLQLIADLAKNIYLHVHQMKFT